MQLSRLATPHRRPNRVPFAAIIADLAGPHAIKQPTSLKVAKQPNAQPVGKKF
jgi:hypothetical protein